MTSIPVKTTQSVGFDIIQTFYSDAKAVSGASHVAVTSIELFFKNRPDANKNASGIVNPGVSVWLAEIVNGYPQPARRIAGTLVRNAYNQILVLADASVSTKFLFSKPVTIRTNTNYAICIKFEDNGFQLWTNKTGNRIVGTNNPSPGLTSVFDGKLYIGPGTSTTSIGSDPSVNPASVPGQPYNSSSTTTTTIQGKVDEDLKFRVNVAKYTVSTANSVVYNKDYEFLTVTKTAGSARFKGGEYVYKATANATGSLTLTKGSQVVTGNSTLFDTYDLEGKGIAVYNGTRFEVYRVGTVKSNTEIRISTPARFTSSNANFKVTPVARVHTIRTLNNDMILVDSTAANSTHCFANNDTIYGSESGAVYTITTVNVLASDRATPRFNVKLNTNHTYYLQSAWSWLNGSAYVTSDLKTITNHQPSELVSKQFRIVSRSLEHLHTGLWLSAYGKRKSTKHVVVMTNKTGNAVSNSTSSFTAPIVNHEEVDVEITQRLVSSNAQLYTSSGGVYYDTEVTSSGTSKTKYISKKIPFANNRFAEDVKVFLTAYRPENTDIKVYCRIHNSADPDGFEQKAWTPLLCAVNSDQYSALNNKNSLIEYTYELPPYADTANTIPGAFTTSSACNVVEASGVDPSTYISANDAVKIYSPLFPNNYQIAIVSAANSTAITINNTVTNNNIIGTGFKVDKLKYSHTAFNNPLNDNVSRYYNNSFAEFDKFDTMQIKIVLTAEDRNIAPEVTQYQMIGVSA